jgi:uncharacterized protein (DUF433 family)
MIDERILPDTFYTTTRARSLQTRACVFIAFYFAAASRLTAEERQRTIALADTSADADQVIDDFLTINLKPFRKEVDDRLRRLRAAEAMVVCDPEILGGMPTIRGTRVPVYGVSGSVAAGISTERILIGYPSLQREQVELAVLYAEAFPPPDRPSEPFSLPPGARLISRRTIPLPKSA